MTYVSLDICTAYLPKHLLKCYDSCGFCLPLTFTPPQIKKYKISSSEMHVEGLWHLEDQVICN